MQVQFGKASDINEWMKFVEEISENFPGLETKEKIHEHRETVLRFMGKEQALCVKLEAKIMGVLLFSKGRNMICCLGVLPDYRRCGIASMLLEKALENLDRTKEVTVSTFREDDEKGIAPRALYKKYGFVADEFIEEFGYPNQKFILYPGCKVIDIYGDNYSGAIRRTREASRAIIVKDGSILLSHEKNIGQWMTPGGGCEANETPEACCIREAAEETGLVVKPEKCFLIINEYYEDVKYVSHYFECSVTGKTERKPTEREIEVGAEPEWIAFDLATDIFSHHRDFAESDEERRGIYLKEYTALTEFVKYNHLPLDKFSPL